ncbi:hypothetical protein GCM10027569_72000 [Flindersiella endophytica]
MTVLVAGLLGHRNMASLAPPDPPAHRPIIYAWLRVDSVDLSSGTVTGLLRLAAHIDQVDSLARSKATFDLAFSTTPTPTRMHIVVAKLVTQRPEPERQVDSFISLYERTVTVSIRGTARSYPMDRYVLGWGLRLTGVEKVDTGHEGVDIDLWTSCNYNVLEEYDFEHHIGLTRKMGDQAFVWALSLAPLLLLIPVISRHALSNHGALSLELAVALFSILPLRQVLVPSSITIPTLVDVVLGVELAAFLAIAAVGYLLSDRGSKDKERLP